MSVTMRTSVISRRFLSALAGVALPLVAMSSAQAQSISEALALAYRNNPTINTARAELRSVDEAVPQALSGWRPQIFGNFDVGGVYSNGNPGSDSYSNTASLGLSVQQALFRGFRTVNSTRQAEAIVRSQRESLRATEQNILFDAAASYMDVIRDTAIVSLRRSNISFLQEQVRAAQDRFEVGEGTRTDVSQAQARLADAQAQLNLALANVNTSRAIFRQVIGEDPKSLSASTSILKFLPKSVELAISIGAQEHPAIQGSLHLVDAAIFNVKTIEGELLPTVTLEGNVGRQWYPPNSGQTSSDAATIFGRVSVPIYQGGQVSSRVREAKEDLGQAQVQVDVARDQIRASIVSAWGQYQASVASISAAQAAVEANQLALEGVIEEQRVGQRTTLDVLNAQLELVDSRVQLVTSQRNRVVAAYLLISSIGRLNAERLGVPAQIYNPKEHYQEVRNSWFGIRTPDGR